MPALMRGADQTWALVVGIDAYDHVKDLTVSRDAVDVVTWLRRLGVPDDQIMLHAAPSDATAPAVEALGITVNGCQEPDLWQSFARLWRPPAPSRVPHGTRPVRARRRPCVPHPGSQRHGGEEPRRRLVRGVPAWPALSGAVHRHGRMSNLPYTAAERSKFVAGQQSGVALPPPRPDVRQVFCFSAQQGEKAQRSRTTDCSPAPC